MTLGCNSFMGFISDPCVMFVVLVTMTSGRVGKTCRYMIREKTGNVAAHLLPYLLHLMFVALWRKPVICRSPHGRILGHGPWQPQDFPLLRTCEASPADITDGRTGSTVSVRYDPGQTNPNTGAFFHRAIEIKDRV